MLQMILQLVMGGTGGKGRFSSAPLTPKLDFSQPANSMYIGVF